MLVRGPRRLTSEPASGFKERRWGKRRRRRRKQLQRGGRTRTHQNYVEAGGVFMGSGSKIALLPPSCSRPDRHLHIVLRLPYMHSVLASAICSLYSSACAPSRRTASEATSSHIEMNSFQSGWTSPSCKCASNPRSWAG